MGRTTIVNWKWKYSYFVRLYLRLFFSQGEIEMIVRSLEYKLNSYTKTKEEFIIENGRASEFASHYIQTKEKDAFHIFQELVVIGIYVALGYLTLKEPSRYGGLVSSRAFIVYIIALIFPIQLWFGMNREWVNKKMSRKLIQQACITFIFAFGCTILGIILKNCMILYGSISLSLLFAFYLLYVSGITHERTFVFVSCFTSLLILGLEEIVNIQLGYPLLLQDLLPFVIGMSSGCIDLMIHRKKLL